MALVTMVLVSILVGGAVGGVMVVAGRHCGGGQQHCQVDAAVPPARSGFLWWRLIAFSSPVPRMWHLTQPAPAAFLLASFIKS
ncbi:hypothetical protein E2C01_050892 [Portunus trituberculatus]|uniref:Secreted protein n=1 Tax=Portunus trituberculatus TaxID=210409 RepID=A0A5B7GHJ7_PORTR|nr:hypothetical protein [Portunus trituberculatus]